ncbi:hypothetical protein BC834DRAFT_831342 [Gloeopeniophorella convolvens]|nr:hypothetical protein BC834DRAFT_831342 [Gloeopeniophorella convolvens]
MKLLQNNLASLLDYTYPNITVQPKPDTFFLERNILTTTKDAVEEINATMLAKFPGNETTLLSTDSVTEGGGANTDCQDSLAMCTQRG